MCSLVPSEIKPRIVVFRVMAPCSSLRSEFQHFEETHGHEAWKMEQYEDGCLLQCDKEQCEEETAASNIRGYTCLHKLLWKQTHNTDHRARVRKQTIASYRFGEKTTKQNEKFKAQIW